MIQVNNFTKSYGNLIAVENLSFQVKPGEILGLVGPNGAGKTTTIRALSGIIPPQSGTLSLAGHDIVENPISAKQNLGYIPDDPRLFDSLTVWEHLEFIASAYGVSDFKTEAEKLLNFFNLKDKRNHVVQNLSRGMRQKVAISCAYLHQPKVLLFDEPLTGLDPEGIRSITESIQQRAASGNAIIISSHLLNLVESLCTHLLVLHHGQCQCFGSMEEVLKMFVQAKDNVTLEDVFFSITHSDNSNKE